MDTSCWAYRLPDGTLKNGETEGKTGDGVSYVAAIFPSPESVPSGWVDSPAKLSDSPLSPPETVNGEGEGETEPAPPPDLDESPSPTEPTISAKDELEMLRAEAAALGIAVDSKWGVRRLRAAIQKVKVDGHGS